MRCSSHGSLNRLFRHHQSSQNSIIATYVRKGKLRDALQISDHILEGSSFRLLDGNIFTALLKACTKLRDHERGCRIHERIKQTGLLGNDLYLGTALVGMYAKFGSIATAQEVFDELPVHDAVLWNSLIAGYAEHGDGERALECLEQMKVEGFTPNAVTSVCSLNACGHLQDVCKGQQIHTQFGEEGLLERDHIVGNCLVGMYGKCGAITRAQHVFDKLPVRDVISWTVLIGGYAEHGYVKEAISCFEKMKFEGVAPNVVTYVCILKACIRSGAIDEGQGVHAYMENSGLLEKEIHLGNALLDMYAKHGVFSSLQELFDKLQHRDVVSWTTVISAFVEQGYSEEATRCFEQMQVEGVNPNSITFISMVKACSKMEAINRGQLMHALLEIQGLSRSNHNINTALVDMYAKCGLLDLAQRLFDRHRVHDIVSWTALISGYSENGKGREALECFTRMQLFGLSSDAVTNVCTLKACGSIGAMQKGHEIHADIERTGYAQELIVCNALIDMYAKCGLITAAQNVFDKLSVKDIDSWNPLISGYAQLGKSENVFHVFERMIGAGVKPDMVTFIIILNACSLTGLCLKSQTYFEAMGKDFGVLPMAQHYCGLLDLLCRAGQIGKATAMINETLYLPNIVVWRSILGACMKCGNVKAGEQAFKEAMYPNSGNAGSW